MKKKRNISLFFLLILFGFHSHAQVETDTNQLEFQDSVLNSSMTFKTNSNCTKLDSIIHFALNQRGKRYKYGTFGPNTFDCSGLMYYTFSQFGIHLGRSSRDQFLNGVKVDLKDIQPGDLVFFYRGRRSRNYIGHVGLVVAVDSNHTFTFVHSSTPKTGVRIDHSDRPGYANTFVGARRILTCQDSNKHTTFPLIDQPSNPTTIKEQPESKVLHKNKIKTKYYTVKQGDTLYWISKKYHISVD